MLSLIELLVQARCGSLNWLCCLGQTGSTFDTTLTVDRILKLRQISEGMTRVEIEQVVRLICQCSVPQPQQGNNGSGATPAPQPTPPTPPSAPQQPTCVHKLLDIACSATGAAAIIAAKEAVDGALLVVKEPRLKTALLISAMALEILEGACVEKDVIASDMAGLCKWAQGVKSVVGGADGPASDALSPLMAFLLSPVATAILACCGDATIAAADVPGWASLIDDQEEGVA